MIKRDLGIIAAIIFLIGFLNFGNFNKDSNNFVSRDNSSITEYYYDVIPLGKWQKIYLSIVKDIESNQILSSNTTITGVECGIYWEKQQMELTKVDNGIKYYLIGYKQYRLLGLPIYKQIKRFDGLIYDSK